MCPSSASSELDAAFPVCRERLQQDTAILEHEDCLLQQALQDRRELFPPNLIAAAEDPFELA